MITRRAYAITIGVHSIQFGLEPKKSAEKRINFAEPFDREPESIVISPFWEGTRSSVGHAETLNAVERHYFETASGTAASNYYVSWIAIGPR